MLRNDNAREMLSRIIRLISLLLFSLLVFMLCVVYVLWEEILDAYFLAKQGGGGQQQANKASFTFPGTASKKETEKKRDFDQETSKMLWHACATVNFEYATALLSHPHVDVNYQNGGQGTPLYALIASGEETPTSIRMVSALLAHKDINPNGDRMTWSPLKMAMSRSHKSSAKLIAAHERAVPQVSASGLSCDVIKDAPANVWFILDDAAADCFKKAGNTMAPNDPRIGQSNEVAKMMKKGAKSSAKSQQATSYTTGKSGGSVPPAAKGASAATSTQGATRESLLTEPGSLVLNPTAFDNIFDAALFYILGPSYSKWLSIYVTSLFFVAPVTTAILCLAHASDAEDKRQAAADEEERVRQLAEAAKREEEPAEAEQAAPAAVEQVVEAGE